MDLPAVGPLPSHIQLRNQWYPVCRSHELRAQPLALALFDQPLVLFRTRGGIGALLDRCPHRNVPLSHGKIVGEQRLQCAYHGWEFNAEGSVQSIPCLIGNPDAQNRKATSFAAREQQGLIWVYATPDTVPARDPFAFPELDEQGYTTVESDLEMEGTLHAVAENALDVPHTAFLHGGLFRTPKRAHTIDVVVRRWADHCEAEYIGEPRPTGLLGKLLAPRGGELRHFDRFHLPCVTEVEYRLGEDSHILVHAALCPRSLFRTHLYGRASFRLPVQLPGAWLARMLMPLAQWILRQDAEILRLQAATLQRFGEEKRASTDVDCLGPQILKLLQYALRADESLQVPARSASRNSIPEVAAENDPFSNIGSPSESQDAPQPRLPLYEKRLQMKV